MKKKKIMELRILTWNCAGIKSKQAELSKRLVEKKVDIGIITERKLNEKTHLRISGYEIIREDRQGGKGSGEVMILIKKGIKREPVTQNENFKKLQDVEMKGIRIQGREKDLSIYGIYRRPGKTNTKQNWDKLVENTGKAKWKIIIGDFNAHNTD